MFLKVSSLYYTTSVNCFKNCFERLEGMQLKKLVINQSLLKKVSLFFFLFLMTFILVKRSDNASDIVSQQQINSYNQGWNKVGNTWIYINQDKNLAKGFSDINGYRYYFDDSGAMQIGWQTIDGKWYYFNSSGVMSTGWTKVKNNWFYMDKDGVMLKGIIEVNGNKYYMAENGAMQIGWQTINGKWYYFNSNGAMNIGWIKSRNNWFYMDKDGVMKVGLCEINGSKYYFEQSGAMASGWKLIDGTWYVFHESGAMNTGWEYCNGYWYHMGENGAMQKGWIQVNGCWYYLDAVSGVMQKGWINLGGTYFYATSTGAIQVGWAYIGDKWYYFNPNGTMATGKTRIGDKNYFFLASGEWIKNPLGIDVSKYQRDIDWEQVSNNVSYAIIKAHGQTGEDPYYSANMKGAKQNGVPVGVYSYTYSTTVDQATNEANAVVQLVNREGGVDLPIYFDIEDAAQRDLDIQSRTDLVNAFCNVVRNSGYRPGVYASMNWFNHYIDMDQIPSDVSIWCARYSSKEPNIKRPCEIWQYSSTGTIPGIAGNVDLDWTM